MAWGVDHSKSPALAFFLTAMVAVLMLTFAWRTVAGYLAEPAAFVARLVLEENFGRTWIDKISTQPNHFEVETRLLVKPTETQIAVQRAEAMARGQLLPTNMVAELVIDIDPSRYGYSLPIFLALLITGSRQKLLRNAAWGAACLIPFQAFSIVMVVIKDAVLFTGVSKQTNFETWQLEALTFAYQLGVLLVPTIAPILLWAWLDKVFIEKFLAKNWRQG